MRPLRAPLLRAAPATPHLNHVVIRVVEEELLHLDALLHHRLPHKRDAAAHQLRLHLIQRVGLRGQGRRQPGVRACGAGVTGPWVGWRAAWRARG